MRRTRHLQLRRVMSGLLVVVVAYLLLAAWHGTDSASRTPEIVLLLPDGADGSDPLIQAWIDAAGESGVPLRPKRASEFLQPLRGSSWPVAVVLPDTVHTRAAPALVTTLVRYVDDGGRLLLVFDAATLTPEGAYLSGPARLSALAGVDYGLYDRYRSKATANSLIRGEAKAFQSLGLPPGKYIPTRTGAVVSTYAYGTIRYPHFRTQGHFDGEKLLTAEPAGDLVAGVRQHGAGRVMFVNLPLGYLRTRSDGALLHGVLGYFNDRVAALPRLLAVPDGVGGLVLNWHVDSNSSYAALDTIASRTSLLDAGPFSVHITAGPDTYRPGDNAGFNLDRDPRARAWAEQFRRGGHALGSHGGWIHNLFGEGVNEDNENDFRHYLELNFASVENAAGRRLDEYSAPQGNQPQWVTDWLADHGVLAYYFTGDTGMAPTRTYRDGQRSDRLTWAFPITPIGRAGSFEEAERDGVPAPAVQAWLRGMVDFASDERTVRLVYFHPPGALLYLHPLQAMLDHADSLDRTAFRWYTMGAHARFLQRREAVSWRLRWASGAEVLEAEHPASLLHMAWQIPKGRYGRPVLVDGLATISDSGEAWLVVAGATRALEVRLAPAESG